MAFAAACTRGGRRNKGKEIAEGAARPSTTAPPTQAPGPTANKGKRPLAASAPPPAVAALDMRRQERAHGVVDRERPADNDSSESHTFGAGESFTGGEPF